VGKDAIRKMKHSLENCCMVGASIQLHHEIEAKRLNGVARISAARRGRLVSGRFEPVGVGLGIWRGVWRHRTFRVDERLGSMFLFCSHVKKD
jgi:hypothetical protein